VLGLNQHNSVIADAEFSVEASYMALSNCSAGRRFPWVDGGRSTILGRVWDPAA
jgi:hypothetical protein